MTDREQRLREIRERHAASTPGEWEPNVSPSEWYGEVRHSESQSLIAELYTRIDAEFIAHAHQDIPFLLAEIERLEKDVKRRDQSISQLINGRPPGPPNPPNPKRPKEYA